MSWTAELSIPGRLADNEQMESIPQPPEFDFIVPPRGEADAQQRAHRKALRTLSARWGAQHAKRVEQLAQELARGSPDAGADERAIYRLVATSTAVSELLGKAQLQLAERVGQLVDEHKAMVMVAKALREVTTVQTATMRSVSELLAAASTMRAQRSIVRDHARRETWHEQVRGGHFDSSGRDQAGRHPSPN